MLGLPLYITCFGVPAITSIDLDLGDTAGGELRTLTGTNFTGATAVTVGGTAVTAFSVISVTEMIIVMPAHAAGASQSILVTNPSGTNAANTLYEFWSPAELALTGYWDRGNYQDETAGTWPGRPSAGSSAGRDLVQATAANQPAEVNLEPNFDGTNDIMTNATGSSTLWGTSGTTAVLAINDSALAYTALYNGTRLVGDDNFKTDIMVSTTLYEAYIRQGDDNFVAVQQPMTLGKLQLIIFRWDTTTLGLTVDDLAEDTDTHTGINIAAGTTLKAGTSSYATRYFDGTLRTLLTMNSRISDANITKLRKWAKAARGLEA